MIVGRLITTPEYSQRLRSYQKGVDDGQLLQTYISFHPGKIWTDVDVARASKLSPWLWAAADCKEDKFTF